MKLRFSKGPVQLGFTARNDTLWRADNFKSWRVIATGPMRAILELNYDPWRVGSSTMSEVKRISIDAGHNVYRQESFFTTPGGGDIPYVIGLVKRPGMTGTFSTASAWAWVSGWGPVAPKNGGDGELGTAVLLSRRSLIDWKELPAIISPSRMPRRGRRRRTTLAQRIETPIVVAVEPGR